MRSRSRMARAIRSTAAGMSRRVIGSCSSSKAGCKNRLAAAWSEKPRCTSTLAAAGPICRAADKAVTICGSGAGSTQRAGGLILGEIPAKLVAFVQIVLCHRVRDLVFRDEKLLVPVGLEFVDVQAGIVVEGQFQRAGHSFVDAQLAHAGLVFALPLPVHFQILDLLQQVVDVA